MPLAAAGRAAVAGLAVLATAACGGGGGAPRSLVVADVTRGSTAVPSLVRIDVDVQGVRRTQPGDAPQKIGVYLPATVTGEVAVIVEGIGAGGVPVARGTGAIAVRPGQVSTVPVMLLPLEPGRDAAPASVDAASADGARALDGPGAGNDGARADAGAADAASGGPDAATPALDAARDAAAPPADRPRPAPDAVARDTQPSPSPDGPTTPPGDAGATQAAFGCPPDPALRACYTFDEASGDAIMDGSGHGNHGTTTAPRGAGAFGRGLNLSAGTHNAVIRHAEALDLPQRQATLEAWIRIDTFTADARTDMLMAKLGGDGAGYAFGLQLTRMAALTTELTGQSGGTLTRGVWSHVAAVFTMTAVIFYHNGVQVAVTGPLDILDDANTAPLVLGSRYAMDPGTDPAASAYAFLGDVDVVRIYGRARTSQEICLDAGGTPIGVSCMPRTPPP